MLFLITGQPGNGKTLHSLGLVEKLRNDPASVAIGREVYQSGIPELTLPWKTLDDPTTWHELPNGSIVVIDECQRVFPPRKQGAAVPKHVSEFETHRHRGFDVFLITQHPQLLDISVRKLVGRHVHVRRTFGQETATLMQWEVATDPNDRGARNLALTSRWTFPKEHYGWYKSAEVHTVKKQLPMKPLLVLAASILGVVGLAWYAGHALMSKGQDDSRVAAVEQQAVRPTVSTWAAESFAPRVPHWSWSQPFYDPVSRVQSAPRVTGCMLLEFDNGSRECKCSNGQGSAQVSPEVCHDFMQGRVYDPLRPFEDKKAANIAYLNAANGGGPGEGSPEGQTHPNRSGLGGSQSRE